LGCNNLYGIKTEFGINLSIKDELIKRADELRADGFLPAFLKTMDICKIKSQLVLIHGTDHNNVLINISNRIKIIFFIDNIICGDTMYYCPDGYWDGFNYYNAICSHLGKLNNIKDYLDAIEDNIISWKRCGAVGMKVGTAYTIGLDFSDPSYNEAENAFLKREDMSFEEIRIVQDYAMRHAFDICNRIGMPVVIHTGFQIWGHADLRQSNPMHLYKIINNKRYKNLIFVLLHGGNPYTGETTYLASMFPNVILDFTWISWMTRTRFRTALAEWIEVVPLEKFCWGSDSMYPEDMCGIDYIVRDEISNVLEDMLKRRMISNKTTEKFIENAFMKTAEKIFSIK
jgi:hypothetical protein